jgi:pyridoxal phosphate enzyme (YggS family)
MTDPDPDPDPDARRAALARSLDEVRARIDAAARAAGRDPGEVSLLAVTKTRPASDVAHLVDLGLVEFGENKEQEGAAKAAELAALLPDAAVRWRVVGRLQRNKARNVARWAHAVDSVDSARLVDALDRAAGNAREAGERAGPLSVLVQVSLDDAPGRGGASLADVPGLADRVAESEHLSLDGVMAVAPQHADPAEVFTTFARLAQRIVADHPGATTLSAGMSGDLEPAIEHGSTCVRVGTALLGAR